MGMGMDPGSGVESDAVRLAECCLEGGWSDFAFAVRVALATGSLGTPVVVVVVLLTVLKLEVSVSRRLPLLRDGERPKGSGVLSPATLDIPS
jgi:hypothetical protein